MITQIRIDLRPNETCWWMLSLLHEYRSYSMKHKLYGQSFSTCKKHIDYIAKRPKSFEWCLYYRTQAPALTRAHAHKECVIKKEQKVIECSAQLYRIGSTGTRTGMLSCIKHTPWCEFGVSSLSAGFYTLMYALKLKVILWPFGAPLRIEGDKERY